MPATAVRVPVKAGLSASVSVETLFRGAPEVPARRVLVQKFGGTSVSTAERRERVIEHVRHARDEGFQVVVVVSAMGRRGDPYATDTLLDLLRVDGGPVDGRDYDLMFTCGEAISVALMSHLFRKAGIPAMGLTSAQARIYTDGRHQEAEVIRIDTSRLDGLLAAGTVPIVTGGQGVAPDTLDYTSLGRGGSDTSGVALGAALEAARVEIFTDVTGVAATDPRLVPEARFLRQVSYMSMHELARFGAGVVHPRAILTGWRSSTPIVVRSTFSDDPGTLIGDVPDEGPIAGIAVLAGMDTLMLAPGDLDVATRARWERDEFMSLVDRRSGALIVGANADRRVALREALATASLRIERAPGACAWVSVVGAGSSLRDGPGTDLPLLQAIAGEVPGDEQTPRRSTYLVPDGARARAVGELYGLVFGAH